MTEPRQHDPVSLTKPLPAPGPLTPYAGPAFVNPPAYAPAYAPVATYPSTTTVVVQQQSNVEIILAWIFTVLTGLYMLPWAVAATRRSTNSILIAVATFFLAWTGIGWLVLFVLSFVGPTVYTARATTTYVALPPPPPAGMWAHCATDPPHVRRWWDGYAWTSHTNVV